MEFSAFIGYSEDIGPRWSRNPNLQYFVFARTNFSHFYYRNLFVVITAEARRRRR